METTNDIIKEMRDWDSHSHLNESAHNEICEFADRIEAAAKRQTMLCLSACSCDLLAKMENENTKLKAALKDMTDAKKERSDEANV